MDSVALCSGFWCEQCRDFGYCCKTFRQLDRNGSMVIVCEDRSG